MTILALAAASKSTSAWDQPGTLGFLVVFGLAVILYFVFRSMVKHLRKVNEAARLEAEQQAKQDQATDDYGSPDGTAFRPPAENGSRPFK